MVAVIIGIHDQFSNRMARRLCESFEGIILARFTSAHMLWGVIRSGFPEANLILIELAK